MNLNFFDADISVDNLKKKKGSGFDSYEFDFEFVGKFVVVWAVTGRTTSAPARSSRWWVATATSPTSASAGTWRSRRTGETKTFYVTGNLGYGQFDPHHHFDSVDDVIFGVGATWVPLPRWSLSGNYVAHNDVDGGDDYSFSLAYDVNHALAARLGAGKESSIYANVLWRFGREAKW